MPNDRKPRAPKPVKAWAIKSRGSKHFMVWTVRDWRWEAWDTWSKAFPEEKRAALRKQCQAIRVLIVPEPRDE